MAFASSFLVSYVPPTITLAFAYAASTRYTRDALTHPQKMEMELFSLSPIHEITTKKKREKKSRNTRVYLVRVKAQLTVPRIALKFVLLSLLLWPWNAIIQSYYYKLAHSLFSFFFFLKAQNEVQGRKKSNWRLTNKQKKEQESYLGGKLKKWRKVDNQKHLSSL